MSTINENDDNAKTDEIKQDDILNTDKIKTMNVEQRYQLIIQNLEVIKEIDVEEVKQMREHSVKMATELDEVIKDDHQMRKRILENLKVIKEMEVNMKNMLSDVGDIDTDHQLRQKMDSFTFKQSIVIAVVCTIFCIVFLEPVLTYIGSNPNKSWDRV